MKPSAARHPLGLLIALFCAGSLPARADNVSTAREHYQRGTTYYDLQRYAEAAGEYELAFEAKDDPVFLYNIGQARRLNGDHAKAVASYKAYLRRRPQAPNRIDVENHIAEMEKLLDEQKRSRERPPAGPMLPDGTSLVPALSASSPAPALPSSPAALTDPSASLPPASPSGMDSHADNIRAGRTKTWAGAGLVAGGVAAVGAGVAFALLAASRFDTLNHPTPGAAYDRSVEAAARTYQTLEVASLGVGVAAAVGGALLIGLGTREARGLPRATLGPMVGGGRIGASLQFQF